MNAQSTIDLRSGYKMPVVGLGTWKLTGQDAVNAVKTALELGYRLIDTSSDYGNLEQVSEGLRKSTVPRGQIFLGTKIEETDDAYEAAGVYLGWLGVDYADLIIIHRPPKKGVGEDLWRGLVQAKADGLTRDIGVSNYSVEQMEELIKKSGVVPAVNQIEWSPFGYSREMLRYCRQRDIVIQAYSPLTHSERLDEEPLPGLADKYGKSAAQTLIRWNIEHKVVPIVKATSREHLAENIDVFDFELSNEDMKMLDGLNEEYSALGQHLIYA